MAVVRWTALGSRLRGMQRLLLATVVQEVLQDCPRVSRGGLTQACVGVFDALVQQHNVSRFLLGVLDSQLFLSLREAVLLLACVRCGHVCRALGVTQSWDVG